MTSIAYITNREKPMWQWFVDSLCNQLSPEERRDVQVIFVDKYARDIERKEVLRNVVAGRLKYVHHTVKPNVWCGEHRLTKEDWFAASNYRNSALCLAAGTHIAYVDDLSVLLPHWWSSVKEAIAGNYIGLGAYKKVKNLVVENGNVVSFDEFPAGIDSRLRKVSSQEPVHVDGGWMFGCSLVAPVEAFLQINGWPEDLCDGLGSEDYCAGIVLEKNGFVLKYDPRMMTYESEEYHHLGTVARRDDWHFDNGVPVRGGNGRDDKSHAALNLARRSMQFDNHFGDGGIRALRERVLKGEQFPIDLNPQHDWFCKKHLSEL